MIKLHHQQPSLWHRGLAEDIEGLWEPWMLLVDKLLEDEQLLDTVYEAQGERHPQSRIRGRMQTPAEVVLCLLLLKHVRNWSVDSCRASIVSIIEQQSFIRFRILEIARISTFRAVIWQGTLRLVSKSLN
jgi:transposase, IS5 family